jgi:beta-lactamase regulating signal transducer with metallopeptidase domain
MSSILFYLFKLSVALTAVYLFYQLVLRRLTFYNWNRWYLLVYTLIAFFIPFIDITPVLEKNEWSDIRIINWVPAIIDNTSLQNINKKAGPGVSALNITIILFISGTLFLFARLITQFISFNRMKKKAKPFSENGLTIYQVNENIIPFSFGNSIFINQQLHNEEELREIIRHEFIHVKQKHSIDIIWGELLCLVNWYNPFAWLLKRSIRQNLEFIADNKVVQNGINKKEYQYLLLRVIGNSQYNIATQFNFSSLKKRIAMMNKTKSAKLQAARFLFLFPLLAIILLAFRKSFTDSPAVKTSSPIVIFTDTIPDVKILNNKGYYIDIKDNKGNCMVVIKDKDKKEVKRLLLTEWNEKADYYENLYGEILSPVSAEVEKSITAHNPAIRTVSVKNNIATVTLKNGKQEVYTLSLSPEKKAFEERCGIQEVVIVPTEALTEVTVADVKPTSSGTTIKSVTSTKPELAEVTVTGVKSANSLTTIKPITSTNAELTEVTVTGVKPNPLKTNVVEQSLGVAEVRILHLGGLTILDEGQYILLDGKEVGSESYGKLTGPYRISFVEKKDAEKKYGSKAKNGVIILETIN